jgi:hypothetical protein
VRDRTWSARVSLNRESISSVTGSKSLDNQNFGCDAASVPARRHPVDRYRA